VAEGETQYNIPVSSKQLIVYFVFLVIALSAAFLAGVMVGRNVDSSPEPMARDIQEDRIPEEALPSPTADALTYGSVLQGDKIQGLEAAPSGGSAAVPPAPTAAPPRATPEPKAPLARTTPETKAPVARATPVPRPSARTPEPARKAAPRPPSAATKARPGPTPLDRFTIQVGAFRERATADSIVKRLKAKGYSAYLVPISEGLFNVRVGSFANREDAERIMSRLETQEKFKPFIVKP